MKRFLRIGLILIVLVLILSMLGYGLFRHRYFPVLSHLAQERAKTAALSMIEDAIAGQVDIGTIRYDRMVFLEKDVNGRITALKTNMQEINRLKSVLLRLIREKVLALDTDSLGIPAGSLLLPEFCAGVGPVIPVHMLAIRKSNAAFSSNFSQAGINQTLHQIHMTVQVEGTILVLGKIQSFSVSSSVLVAETVIVGDVPNSVS